MNGPVARLWKCAGGCADNIYVCGNFHLFMSNFPIWCETKLESLYCARSSPGNMKFGGVLLPVGTP